MALDEKCDDVKFHKACMSSNIQSLIDKLAKGAETQIGKEIDPEGIEPSGGEATTYCHRKSVLSRRRDFHIR